MDEMIRVIQYIWNFGSWAIAIVNILVFLYTLYLVSAGIFPVLYRIGVGLSKRKIAHYLLK